MTSQGQCLWRGVGLQRLAGATLVLLLLSACSGGGGGGDDSNPVTCTNLTFDRALSTPAAGDVYFEQATGNCNQIDISVLISNLSGIYTVGFDLTYPSSLLQYQSYTLGPLMQKGNPQNTVFVQVATATSGVIEVAISRLGQDAPVTASGSEGLITFRFSKVAAGAAVIDFDMSGNSMVSEAILDDDGPPGPSAQFGPGHGGLVTVP